MNKYRYKLIDEKGNVSEKVVNGKKVYNKNEIIDWVRFGLNNGFIDKENKEVVSWIKLLKDKVIDL